jgi:hypothetical protein
MISDCFRAQARWASVSCLLWLAVAAFGCRSLAAQDEPNIGAFVPAPASKNVSAPSPHRKNSAAKVAVQTPAPAPDPAPAPPAPEPPKWPLNDAPAPASVKWDSHGLQVDATNSSLRQILDEVATATGAKVEGLGPDERVFGEYGPGPARDVLSQILHGSSYNVLMLGDQGEGTPRQIILSQRTAGGAQANQASNRQNPQDDDADQPAPEPDEPNRQTVVQPQPMNQPNVNQPGGPMTPQQRMLEMQRQQMQMQQQQNQNQNQPIQPPPQPPQE